MTTVRYTVDADQMLIPESVEEVPAAPAKALPAPAHAKRPIAPRVDVEVTREIIDSAQRRDSGHCMIADAVKAVMPTARQVSVDLQTIRWSDPARRLRYVYLTPQLAQIALLRFDQGHPTEPFRFRLRGAQVTKLNPTNQGRTRPVPPPKDGRRTPRMPDGLKKELVRRNGGPTNVPDVVGGRTPPMGALAQAAYRGMRRVFGLRVLKP